MTAKKGDWFDAKQPHQDFHVSLIQDTFHDLAKDQIISYN